MENINRRGAFSEQERAKRLFARVARVVVEMWEEDVPAVRHTRLLEGPWIPDDAITVGVSRKGADHREHIVPLACIRDRYIDLLDRGANESQIADLLSRYLKIVLISREEQIRIDKELRLKTCMPEGWSFDDENSDPFARLRAGCVDWDYKPE